ncbi:hypothetical protein ACE1CI_19560 [Aerosakkonemataceae cyanobacterium BLCC-F50]|uniref:Uncharacterized protein n=1 Tax=Floridaenema flaviceps BLCC-F50 TaxID=3153642 RepID=A0ABV4XTS2_9CYAN
MSFSSQGVAKPETEAATIPTQLFQATAWCLSEDGDHLTEDLGI